MKVVVTGRRGGKTTKAIEFLRKNPNCLFVAFSHDEMVRLKNQYRDVASRIVDVDWMKGSGQWGQPADSKIIIDNADHILQRMFPLSKIEWISITGEESEP